VEAVAVRAPSDAEFALLAKLIEREAGIYLAPVKKALLVSRIGQRLRTLGVSSYAAYYRRIAGGDDEERVQLINAICTHETRFFREPHHFEMITRKLVPSWRADARAGLRERKVRVWSAGCSTGEEPYSLAMCLLDALPTDEGWEIEILATDLSTRALTRAEAAIYPRRRLEEVPPGVERRHLLRGIGDRDGEIKVAPATREPVRFKQLNLVEESYAAPSALDLVMCRNVLIYFKPETRDRVVRQLTSHLRPGGHLFLGHAESLRPDTAPLRVEMPTVYRRERAGAA
jgi:chemotaxis protein methyltransferase CheR